MLQPKASKRRRHKQYWKTVQTVTHKLGRVISYLKGTVHLALVIDANAIKILTWNIDASFVVHLDCKTSNYQKYLCIILVDHAIMVFSEMTDVRDFRCFGINKIISLFRDHCDHYAIDQQNYSLLMTHFVLE